ncbi:MAG: Fur family transcriptional regulator [Candidatus Pacebacteria bacterium]|nr:Fur family transcriptional regulator [Candidatus Paceibacterota bacterium]
MKKNDPGYYDTNEFLVPSEAHGLLWTHKLRATKPRLELFDLLSKEKEPLSVLDIYKKIGARVDRATIFRTLEQFCKAGISVKIISPFDDHSLYEMKSGRSHHHHVICVSCGDLEDVGGCDAQDLNISARAHLKKFRSIQSHSLEFFGLCRKCEDKSEDRKL